MKIIKLEKNGVVKEVKEGFSWTAIFFGIFVPMLRGDLKWAAISILANVIGMYATYGIGTFVFSIWFAFQYNEIYKNELLEKGYNYKRHSLS